jgi:RNA polymerase sigma-70 factor (ECF subfamily)
MGDTGEAHPKAERAAMAILREGYGFVPGMFHAQGLLPRLVEAEAALADAILFQDTDLSRIEKESIVLAEAASEANLYCVALQFQTLSLLGVPKQRLTELVGPHQIELSPTLESCLSLAWASFACTLAMGLGTSPDFPPPPMPTRPDWATLAKEIPISKPAASDDAIGLAFFRKQLGFVPNLFRLQASLPEALEAEAKVMAAILSQRDLLPPQQKEMLMLAVSGSNRNDYGTALWGELLRKRGTSLEISDHSPPDQALFDFARKLGARTGDFNRENIQRLKEHGFADSQIVEAIATAAFANFLNTLQICLRAEPDFAVPELVWTAPENNANPLSQEARPTDEWVRVDSDWEIVQAVRDGNADAFEQLIERHSRRVYRTLAGILGDAEDARDAMQDTFLKAFQHLDKFEGRSKFSTWLLSIATNAGLQRLRDRRPLESLDENASDSEESFRPRQVGAWVGNPEQLYSQAERRRLVESSVMKLPPKYRIAVLLRDLELLSTEEAAAALGLPVPTLKSRLLRGRLMLREALAPHFARRASEVAH